MSLRRIHTGLGTVALALALTMLGLGLPLVSQLGLTPSGLVLLTSLVHGARSSPHSPSPQHLGTKSPQFVPPQASLTRYTALPPEPLRSQISMMSDNGIDVKNINLQIYIKKT